MARVGFIGLGVMGLPMASNLARAGHEVRGYDAVPAALDRFVAGGGRAVDSVAEAVDGADVIFTLLPDSPEVEAVALGLGGIVDVAHGGQLYVDTSSIAADVSRDVSRRARVRGLRPLDAPVSGGEAGAVEGSLSIMVGSNAEDFAAARPYLEVLGTTIAHVGGDGAGQTVKVANRLIVAGVIELVAEAIVLLESCDVEVNAALEVLAGGLAGNRILDRKRVSMVERDFRPGFRVDLHHKDLGNLMATARRAGVPLPLGAVVTELMASLRARGGGLLDHSGLLLLVEELAGRGARVGASAGG